MVIVWRMRQYERRAKLAIKRNERPPLLSSVGQLAVGKIAREQLGFQKPRRSRCFLATHGSQIGDRCGWLPLVTLAQHTNADRRSILPGPSQGAGAQQLRIVRVGNDGQYTFTGEI